jgi:hypothetical protein
LAGQPQRDPVFESSVCLTTPDYRHPAHILYRWNGLYPWLQNLQTHPWVSIMLAHAHTQRTLQIVWKWTHLRQASVWLRLISLQLRTWRLQDHLVRATVAAAERIQIVNWAQM